MNVVFKIMWNFKIREFKKMFKIQILSLSCVDKILGAYRHLCLPRKGKIDKYCYYLSKQAIIRNLL